MLLQLYEGRLKVMLLLRVSSHDFEHTFIICILSEQKNTARPAQIKTKHQIYDM